MSNLKVIGPLRRVAVVKRHLAPIHPGTGTDQSVHAGDGTSGLRDPSIPDDVRGMTFYHATSDQGVGEEIIRDTELQASAEAGGQAMMSPVVGKVYATSDPEYALIYALGGDMAGTESSDWTEKQILEKGRYSYIFEVDSDSLNKIQPDEDSIGEAISDDTYPWLTRLAKRHLTENQLSKVMWGEYAYWAQAGKKLVPLMTDEMKFELIRDGAHIANEGGLSLGKIWRIDKRDISNFQRYTYDEPDTSERRQERIDKIWELAELVQRHGDHEDQAGVPGQKGGSAPGYTHVGATPEGEGKKTSSQKATAKAIENLKGLGLENSFSLVGSVAGKVVFEGPEGHTKVFDVETGQWEHSDEDANALLKAIKYGNDPLIDILEPLTDEQRRRLEGLPPGLTDEELAEALASAKEPEPLRSGNARLETYADAELSTKRMVNQIADAGFGLTGKDYPGTGDNAYIFNLMAQLNPAIRSEGYHVDDQLTVIHQSKLKIILDAIEYEAERSGLKMGDDLAAVMALNATLEYPDFKEVTGQDWDPHDDFILEGINEEFQRRMVMEAWDRTTIQGKSLDRGVAPGNITSPAEGRPLEESYGLDPGVIQTWTTVNNLSKETSEALYQNYLARFSTPGTAEHKYRFEGETPFDSLNNVIFSDKYSWVPRDEGPQLEQAASYMNRGWQITTSSPEAIVLTEVVAEQHGGTPIPRSNFDEEVYRPSADSLGPDAFRDIRFSNDTAEIATDIYQRTQQQLADSGLKRTDTVRLYRGMDKSGDESTWNPSDVQEGLVEVEMYSLSSWTPSPSVAKRFSGDGGWMIAADIPVQRLWANADTGPPSKGEQEWMVLGINGIQGAILTAERAEKFDRTRAASFSETMDDYFDAVLERKTKHSTISPDLTHMMWITTLIENETGLDSTKVPVKDVRDAELVVEQDAKALAAYDPAIDEQPVERHAAPIHPGTGTDQSVHAGDGGGGRQPGDDFPEVGITEGTWKRQPFDKDLAGAYADSIEDEFGRTPSDKTRNATWIAPDGRKLAEGSIHEDTSMHAVSAVSGVDTDDITIAETQVIQAGLIRHTSFTYGQDTFVVSGVDTLTRQQARAIRNMMDDRVDSRAGKQIQSDSDKYRVGLRLYVVEDIPPTLDPISRNLEQISGGRALRLLGLKRSEWRVSREDTWGQLIVSTAPRRDWRGKLITESKPVERHLAPIHPGTGTDQSVHSPTGESAVEDHLEGPDSFGNLAGDFATVTGQDTLVKLLKFTPEVDEEGNVDLEAVGTWEVEIITGPSAGYIEEFGDYDLDYADVGDTWTTDTSPGATLERAEGIFGITESMSEAGYILPDGRLLDFSGGPGGEGSRALDHRNISQALLEDQGGEAAEEYSGGMIYFMGHTGAIRTSYFGGRGVTFTLDIARQPTQAQWRTLLEWSEFTDELIVDISDPDTGARLWSNSSFNQSDPPATIRELREQAQELLGGSRVMRMVIRSKNSIPKDVSEAMDELMLAVRALSTGDLKTFIRTRWSDYNSHLGGL